MVKKKVFSGTDGILPCDFVYWDQGSFSCQTYRNRISNETKTLMKTASKFTRITLDLAKVA